MLNWRWKERKWGKKREEKEGKKKNVNERMDILMQSEGKKWKQQGKKGGRIKWGKEYGRNMIHSPVKSEYEVINPQQFNTTSSPQNRNAQLL